ncbi:E3 ubiquitin-protein ligase TRIM56 [Hemicordylus capensis]|uniref:E3 ubiquitin-protein ligase TRIM56 n=1 Tax=Hemicordylus capensis TaxID=884348 RepID=UPI0023034EDC|nr:E3 ubiquitin-protein ligase TRIM56 [Hemicordylus capensis]
MAAPGGPSLSEALTSSFLTCTICLERFCQPKILPCLHTYCCACLERLEAGRQALQCPECRQRVPLPAGVGSLQTNFFINGLLDLLARPAAAPAAPPTCSLCPLLGRGAGQPAASRCLDCADDMCRACARGHRCSRLTHAHCIVAMEGYLSGQHDEELRKRQASRCREHPGEELRFFCRPCAAALCRECRLGPHLEHPCLPLAQAAQERRPLIAGLLAGVEEKVRLIARSRAGLEERLQRLEGQEASIREAVERAGAAALQQLLAHQEEVLGQLSACVAERRKACGALRAELELQEQVASSTVAFAQKVLGLGREAEVVSLEQMISERLRQLRDFSWEPLSFRLPRLELLQSSCGSLFRLECDQEEEEEEEEEEEATKGTKKKKKKRKPQPQQPQQPPSPREAGETPGQGALLGEGGPGPAEAPTAPAREPEAPRLTPRPLFWCSFWVKIPSDKKRPQVTGICPFGSAELLVADAMNRKLKRFSLQGEFKGTIPVPDNVAPFSVAAVGSKVAFTAGSRLYLLNGEGGLVWQKALQLGQASHAVTALEGGHVVVSVAGRLEVYDLEGRLVQKVVPEGGSQERCLVFLARWKGGLVGSDWYRHSLVMLQRSGQLVAELRPEQLSGCQPGAVCADAAGTVYVVLREVNKVAAFSKDGEQLGLFLTAEDNIDRPRVATVTREGRFAVALSNGTVHIFKIRYQGK